MRFRVLDLFCGAGGLSEGFRQAGYEVVGASDVDPDACATYDLNFPDANVVCGDLREPNIRQALLEMAAACDVVAGGPPCQAYSQVRNHTRLIDDPRNSLYREFVRVVRSARPKAFVMENVPGMDQMGVRSQIEEDLSLQGRYHVRSQLVDAAEFGVPQTRRRLLFLGLRKDLGVSAPLLLGSGISDRIRLARSDDNGSVAYKVEHTMPLLAGEDLAQLASQRCLNPVTVEQAIGDLKPLQAGVRNDQVSYSKLLPASSAFQQLMRHGAGKTLCNTQVPRINDDTALRLAEIPPGGNHRDLPEAFLARYLTGAKWGPHNGSGRLTRKHYYAYRRLHPAIWAWTLNTKADSAYHYQASRALSVREFARIQSFPDRFVFTTDPRKGSLPGRHDGGAAHSRYRQVGNAVPPLLARAIAAKLYDVLVDSPPAGVSDRLAYTYLSGVSPQ